MGETSRTAIPFLVRRAFLGNQGQLRVAWGSARGAAGRAPPRTASNGRSSPGSTVRGGMRVPQRGPEPRRLSIPLSGESAADPLDRRRRRVTPPPVRQPSPDGEKARGTCPPLENRTPGIRKSRKSPQIYRGHRERAQACRAGRHACRPHRPRARLCLSHRSTSLIPRNGRTIRCRAENPPRRERVLGPRSYPDRATSNSVTVVAFAHFRRRPGYWKKRRVRDSEAPR